MNEEFLNPIAGCLASNAKKAAEMMECPADKLSFAIANNCYVWALLKNDKVVKFQPAFSSDSNLHIGKKTSFTFFKKDEFFLHDGDFCLYSNERKSIYNVTLHSVEILSKRAAIDEIIINNLTSCSIVSIPRKNTAGKIKMIYVWRVIDTFGHTHIYPLFAGDHKKLLDKQGKPLQIKNLGIRMLDMGQMVRSKDRLHTIMNSPLKGGFYLM